jgi:DNA-binding beta-propeller fold protein YncE
MSAISLHTLFGPALATACSAVALLTGCAVQPAAGGPRELLIIGNDEKVTWDDAGKQIWLAPGKDSVSIVDIADRLNPRIIVNLPLMNTIVGPPTNLAITPDQKLALVANSLDVVKDGAGWKSQPDDKLYVIDLEANPPRLIDTITVGKQPSGMSINRAGDLALIANRAGNSISVLKISGKSVKLLENVSIGEQVANVAISPDGKRALAAKFAGHKVAMLEIDGDKVTYKQDIPTGLWPYNLAFTPDGRLAIIADNGNAGSSDGHVDTVTVIDMEAAPPRVIDKVVVGDAPEGFAISPTGKFAVAVLLHGTNAAKASWFYHRNAMVVGLRIDGKKVTRTNEVEVRGLPEGVAFSSDGNYLYIGNYIDSDVSILRVDGDQLVNTGKSLQLPGHPASMRGATR